MSINTDGTSTDNELLRQVRDALAHLYDYTHLERHPLAEQLAAAVSASGSAQQTRAQLTRRVLLDAMEELNPGDNVPVRALERRAHTILFGLYVEGRDAQSVAASLGIGGRQLRRDRAAAVEALTNILSDRYLAASAGDATSDAPASPAQSEEETLRAESARLAQQRERVHVDSLVRKLLPLLNGLAAQSGSDLRTALSPDLPPLEFNETLLRQILLSLTSQVLTHWSPAAVTFVTQWSDGVAGIGLRLDFAETPAPTPIAWEGLNAGDQSVDTLAAALGGRVRFEAGAPGSCTLWLLLPHGESGLDVLVVDDTHDLFELFQRYVAHGTEQALYRLSHAPGVDRALDQIREGLPDAIILDLMMPNRDGWDLLQELRTDPATARVPVIVCSVLHEPELAFSLGAQHYLKKPVGSTELLQVLDEVRQGVRQQAWAAAAHPEALADSAGSGSL